LFPKGVVLTPKQMNQMVDLADTRVRVLKDHVERKKAEWAQKLGGGGTNEPSKSNRPTGAVGYVKHDGKEYWVDKDRNNLGEKIGEKIDEKK
jgi:hypothetical protein